MTGIVSYGVYVPSFRLKVEDIWDVWMDPVDTAAIIKERRGVTAKAVGRWDEDAITMAVYAAKASLQMGGMVGADLDALYFGSCTNPYASKAAAPIIAEALKTKPELMCADCQFAAKSGTATLQICTGMVASGMAKYALAIGSDALSRHIPPNDPNEYTASCGAAAVVVGSENVVAKIEGCYTYTTQTPEFFRLDGERYIKHAANENVEDGVGYRKHVEAAVKGYMDKYGSKPQDFSYVAISQPDGRLPFEVGKEMGFTEEQLRPGMLAGEIGDSGSASALLGLAAILDQARSGERIILIAYGFGAGCDVFGLCTTPALDDARRRKRRDCSINEFIANKEYISYAQYLRQERKLIQEYI